MNLDEACALFNRLGIYTQNIETLTLDIEGIRGGASIFHVEDVGDYLVGNLFMISRERNGDWVAEIVSSHKTIKISARLEEAVDAICDYFNLRPG